MNITISSLLAIAANGINLLVDDIDEAFEKKEKLYELCSVTSIDALPSWIKEYLPEPFQDFGKNKEEHSTDVKEEWKRYRLLAINSVKRGEPIRKFVSDILPEKEHSIVERSLSTATTIEDVRNIFLDAKDRQELMKPETQRAVKSLSSQEVRCMVCGCGEPMNDHGMPYPTAVDYKPATGAMIAFFLPNLDAEKLELHEDVFSAYDDIAGLQLEKAKDLHVTSVYLADDIEETTIDKEQLLDIVREWARNQFPFLAHTLQYDKFGPNNDGNIAIVLRLADETITTYHNSLLDALGKNGITSPSQFIRSEYKPHITLCYVDKNSSTTPFDRPIISDEIRFGHVWIAWGMERYAFRLGEEVVKVTPGPSDHWEENYA